MVYETRKVASDDTESGYMLINASDFDPAIHEPMEEEGEGSGPASDIAPLPSVAKLAAVLESMTDADAIRAMLARDARKSAAPLYEARLSGLAG